MARLNLWRVEQPHVTFDRWDSFGREFERMFNDMSYLLPTAAREEDREAMLMDVPYTIENDEGHFILSFDIPGVSKEDVDIEINAKQLVISGVRRPRSEQKSSSLAGINARRFGQFRRVFTLPDGVNSEGIQAQYEHGVLHLVIPKAESAKPRRITIEEGTGGFFKKLLGKDKSKLSQEESATRVS